MAAAGEALLVNSEQLDLGLFKEEPWDGRSPRSLTRVGLGLFSEQERQKSDRFFVDPDQTDMFRRRQKKAPRVSRGAPLLVPLPEVAGG